MSDAVYKAIERAYKKLWGQGDLKRMVPDTEIDGNPFLVERNFTQNIGEVIGTDCAFFGKILYLYFAKGYDQAKISMQRFFQGLVPYVNDDDRQKHNQTSFKILDIDNDNILNVINLMTLFKNLPSHTRLGQELFKVIEYFLEKNLYNKSILAKVQINKEVYMKICT